MLEPGLLPLFLLGVHHSSERIRGLHGAAGAADEEAWVPEAAGSEGGDHARETSHGGGGEEAADGEEAQKVVFVARDEGVQERGVGEVSGAYAHAVCADAVFLGVDDGGESAFAVHGGGADEIGMGWVGGGEVEDPRRVELLVEVRDGIGGGGWR